jgi:polysaccharide export outer membrane protein
MSIIKVVRVSFVILVILLIQGCNPSKKSLSLEEFKSLSNVNAKESLNAQIRSAAALDKADSNSRTYRLGAGDLLEISVFRVEDLTREARVNGNGQLFLPLIGILEVDGMSIPQVESTIAKKLSKDYIQDAQVSVFIKEYRSQEITVMGAVGRPDVYSVKRSRGVVEMLSLAGGVSEEAADSIRISTTSVDEVTGEPVKRSYVLSINGLLSDREALSGLTLGGGDAIFVPEAGVVYVEGAVKKPGAYKMSGDVTVLQALSLAGGPKWEGDQSRVKIVRNLYDEANSVEINLNKVRDQQGEDIVLQDGDIVIVDYGTAKTIFSGFLNGVRSIVGFGYNLNQ